MRKLHIKPYYYFYYFIFLTFIALIMTTVLSLKIEGQPLSLWSRSISLFIWFYLWGLWSPLIFWLTRKFSFESRRKFLRNLIVHGFFGILISMVHFTAFLTLIWLLDSTYQNHYPSPLPIIKSTLARGIYLIGLFFYLMIVFAFQAYLSQQHYAAEEKKAAQLESELMKAHLQALKMQLQPHFLFNALNSVSSLVLTNSGQAYAMIAKLGDFLRMTLDYSEDQMVTVREELRFLRSYLEIEETRFSDRLKVDFEIENEVLSAFVPHLVLQPIVENSIKYGIAQRSADGIIEIKAGRIEDKLYLQVKNSRPEKEALSSSTEIFNENGTGLKNIRARLHHLYENDYSFEMKTEHGGETIVTVVLPLNFNPFESRENKIIN